MTLAEEGWVGSEIEAEFPGLGLVYLNARLGDREDARAAKVRLAGLEEYFSGSVITALPARPLTAAYRVFYRQVGLDPEVDRTLVERIARDRLARGKFTSRGHLADALVIAAIETEIPVQALRADRVLGPLGIAASREGERLGDLPLPESSLVVADATRPLAMLVGDEGLPSPHTADKDDREVVLYAAIVPGVSPMIAQEALWRTAEMLGPQAD